MPISTLNMGIKYAYATGLIYNTCIFIHLIKDKICQKLGICKCLKQID